MRIAFTGDIFLGDQHWTFLRGCLSQLRAGSSLFDESLSELLLDADYLIGNLETPIVDIGKNMDRRFCYSTSSQALKLFLGHVNKSFLSVANNHIFDHGIEGYHHTIKTLEENQVNILGSKDVLPEEPFHYLNHENGELIGVGAFCDGRTGIRQNNILWMMDNNDVVKAVRKANSKARWTIVFLHWGKEYVSQPSTSQTEFLQKLIDAGADIIVGHHPHVMHPIVVTNNAVIASSLGNFVFDQYWSRKTRRGALLLVEISEDKIDCEVYLTRIHRKLPVRLVGKLSDSLIRKELNGLPDSIHLKRSKSAEELHRILARIDWLLHSLPHPVDKFKCLKYWARE